MSGGAFGSVLVGLRSLFDRGTSSGLSEAVLLDRYVSNKDEQAFEVIVSRYGPMVLGICRRMLDDPRDIEDAFQATFLVLVRKAGSLRDRDLLAKWLYGVAYRVATRARATAYRHRKRERPAQEEVYVAEQPLDDAAELRAVLDDELARLPGRLRSAVILCDLEGLPQEEAAARLGCRVGTVKSRLSRARVRLRARLLRRGVAPAAWLTGSILEMFTARVSVPAALHASTMCAASSLTAGAVVRAPIAAIVESVVRSMSLSKIKIAVVSFLATALVAAGTLAIAKRALQNGTVKAADTSATLPKRERVRNALAAWWAFIETLEFRDVSYDLDTDDRPILGERHSFAEVDFVCPDRLAVMRGTVEADGQIAFGQERQDTGRIRFYLGSEDTVPAKVTSLTIANLTSTRGSYHVDMGTVLWLITPWSKKHLKALPLFAHLDEGSKLEFSRDAHGRPRVTLILEYGSERYELDPEHDFLPKRVTGSLFDISVTRFTRDHAHWFPVEGVITLKGESKSTAATKMFRVTALAINRQLPAIRFESPPDRGEMRLDLENLPIMDLSRAVRSRIDQMIASKKMDSHNRDRRRLYPER